MSYTRFVELTPSMLTPLLVYLQTQLGACTGIDFSDSTSAIRLQRFDFSDSTSAIRLQRFDFIDSTPLAVCHTARIPQHRVFQVDAARGKTSVGWFYGFKLHLVVNDRGELLAFCLTRGNVDDRTPVPAPAPSGSCASWASSSVTRATSRSP